MKKSASERNKERILNAGLKLWPVISVQVIADEVNMTRRTVYNHFPENSLKNAIAEHAVEKGYSRVIVQLIACNHKAVENMSSLDRTRHFQALV